jgi:hypothetical protein
MDEIKKVIGLFIEPYKADKNIQAAILTGSYAQGNENKYSDIDIYIISSDDCNWRERGNKIESDFMIEYFINPPRVIIQEMENGIKNNDRVTAILIANGEKIFDKTGIINIISEKAFEVIKTPLKPIENTNIERMKYFTNYYYEQLTRAYENNINEFMYLYYTFLEHIIYSYGTYKGIILSPRTKIYQYIFDKEYNMNKFLKKITDKTFLELLQRCMEKSRTEIMYKNITELEKYFIDLLGGFNLNGWKMRSEIKI